MAMTHTQRLRAALALCFLPVAAVAQPVSMPTRAEDVFSVEAGAGVEHHSNLFRAQNGESDTILRALLGIRAERELSLQRFSGFANLQPVKYISNSRYDFVGLTAGAGWDWQIGRPLFGNFSAGFTRDQTPFDVIGFDATGRAQNNLRNLVSLRALGGLRLTQGLSAIAAVDRLNVENSLDVQRGADFRRTGAEVGMRYAPGGATEFDVVYRREDGDFPNRQVFDALGLLLPAAVDNQYTQDGLLLRLGWRPSEASRLSGNVGYTRRSFENLPQRDFSGVTAGLDAEWPLSGQVLMRASVFRSIDTIELLNASYIDAIGFGIRPTWQVTSRIAIDGILSYATRSYQGDPRFVISNLEVREDKLTDLGVRVNYELARRIALYGDLRTLRRTSNYQGFDFTDNWFGVGVRGAF